MEKKLIRVDENTIIDFNAVVSVYRSENLNYKAEEKQRYYYLQLSGLGSGGEDDSLYYTTDPDKIDKIWDMFDNAASDPYPMR